MSANLFRCTLFSAVLAAGMAVTGGAQAQTNAPTAMESSAAVQVAGAHHHHNIQRHSMRYRGGHHAHRKGHRHARYKKHGRHGAHHHKRHRGSAHHSSGHYRGSYGQSRRYARPVMWVPGYGGVTQQIVDSLELTSKQEDLLTQAQDATRKNKVSWSRKPQKTLGTTRSEKTIDPHSMLEDRKEQHTERQAKREAQTEKWLALWDALEPEQQEAVSDYISTKRSGKKMRGQVPAKKDSTENNAAS